MDDFPDLALPCSLEAIYQAEGRTLYAEDCRLGLIELTRELGLTSCPILTLSVYCPMRGMAAETSAGITRAEYVVLAGTGWSNQLLEPPGLAIPLKITREHIVYYPYRNHLRALPFIVHHSDRAFDFYGLPDGRQPAMKLDEHGVGPKIEPNTEPVFDALRSESVHSWVSKLLPVVRPESQSLGTCRYANTPDDDFVIQRIDRLVLGMGLGGHGIKFGAVVPSSQIWYARSGGEHSRPFYYTGSSEEIIVGQS